MVNSLQDRWHVLVCVRIGLQSVPPAWPYYSDGAADAGWQGCEGEGHDVGVVQGIGIIDMKHYYRYETQL